MGGYAGPFKFVEHAKQFRCAAFVGLFAISGTPAYAAGSLTIHMAGHIVLMNVLAPVVALMIVARMPSLVRRSDSAMLTGGSVTQVAVLWTVHSPALLAFAMSGVPSHASVQAALFLVALWFWWAVLIQPPQRFWRALFALLITGKLFCLLGALLVFAPRALYRVQHGAHHVDAFQGLIAVEDQQLAGLLMLVACPLSYVAAGIVIASRALRALDRDENLHALPNADSGRG
jgi:putative membrane protein